MKYIIVCIFFLSKFSVFSQTTIYHPFPESNAVWNINYSLNCNWAGIANENYSISFSNDTTINLLTYHKLTTSYIESFSTGTCGSPSGTINYYRGAVRQEVSNKKVFIVPPDSAQESLLFDFNLNVGDTVRGFTEDLGYEDVVQSIDSVFIGSDYRKRWNINSGYQISFIEGIGSTFGLVEKSPGNIVDGPGYYLTCYNQDNRSLYPDTNSQCSLINNITSHQLKKTILSVSPNPSSGNFKINLSMGELKLITIYNSMGNVICIFENEIGNQLEVDNFSNGIYTLIGFDKSGNAFSSKIICIR